MGVNTAIGVFLPLLDIGPQFAATFDDSGLIEPDEV
jgi:hypothetical protein